MATETRGIMPYIVLAVVIAMIHPARSLSQDGPPAEGAAPDIVIGAEWTLLDQVDFDLYLEAGTHLGIRFDQVTQRLEPIAPVRPYELTAAAEAARAKAPQWLRHELTWVLAQIPGEYQDLWAGAINDARDPYIDEIAFAIAYSSPQYLTSDYGDPELFVRNAELIYENDALLDYVEVIDYGTSDSNDNYYSTTRYVQSIFTATRTGSPVVITAEAPRDIYYWYVVHPKVSSEIPAFIDPNLTESNRSHDDNIAAPPAGFFWRDYLLNHADPGYPVLKDRLTQCSVAGDGTSLSGGNTIGAINSWINASMAFTSEGERPHQPVRIYDKHIGRCGEYADLTTAVARAALIPCTSVCSTSTDHIWNEFWHERWIQWEPVNNSVDEPMVYEDGWGKVFGTVYEIRSEGQIRSVTDRYSAGTATIDVNVTDAAGRPVDGAEVNLYMQSPGSSRAMRDFYALTDNEGKCSFVVGEGLSYYARVSSAVGNEPNAYNERIELVQDAVAGGQYGKTIVLPGLMPATDCTVVDVPTAGESPYQLVISFAVPEQLLMGDVFSDDLETYTQHLEKAGAGQVDFFMTDAANYLQLLEGAGFEACNVQHAAHDGAVAFTVPLTEDWYCLFSNEANLNNLQHLTGTVSLYGR